jgi:hypothetical protein
MHPSYEPGRKTYSLSSYLDDSGSDEHAPITAIGGPTMSEAACIEFGAAWSKMLVQYRIEPPLHMTDFVGGKCSGMFSEMKLSLFGDVVRLINDYRLYSVSVSVPQVDFRALLSEEVRRNLIGPYAMAFFCTVLNNQEVSSRSSFYAAEPIAYIVDKGFSFSDQLTAAHAAVIKAHRAEGRSSFIGAITFDSDDRIPALQAADVIAWSARKRVLDGRLPDGFAPLEELFASFHAAIRLDARAINMLAAPINRWLSMGILTSLSDVLR